MENLNPVPTRRAVLYVTFKCNAACQFCYEKYSGRWGQEKTLEAVKGEILQMKDRGCNKMDISGGESTIYPWITEVIKFALDNGIKTCIITNGLLGEDKTNRIIEAGLEDWLVSLHGTEETHDMMVGVKGARKAQIRFLNQIKGRIPFRFNTVIHGHNQQELVQLAQEFKSYNPWVWNFINFNPHNGWGNHPEEVNSFIADLRQVESNLNQTIEILEKENIRVNVRYYPMCRIAEKYRKCICNDRQVMFELEDPVLGKDINAEWDYSEMPKTYEQYNKWGIRTSNNIEEKGEPCCKCELQNICGGINKIFNNFTSKKMVDPVYNTGIEDKNDFYYYRRNNVLTLNPRG